jgi:GAF domain-containing protein
MAEIVRIATALPRGLLAGRLFAQWFHWLRRHQQFLEAVASFDAGGLQRAQLTKVIGDLVHAEDRRPADGRPHERGPFRHLGSASGSIKPEPCVFTGTSYGGIR